MDQVRVYSNNDNIAVHAFINRILGNRYYYYYSIKRETLYARVSEINLFVDPALGRREMMANAISTGSCVIMITVIKRIVDLIIINTRR